MQTVKSEKSKKQFRAAMNSKKYEKAYLSKKYTFITTDNKKNQ